MSKIKAVLQEERGNVILFVLGIVSVLMIFFILILNLGAALVVKEQAMSTSQQAAIAATAALFEELPDFISDYETELMEWFKNEAGEGETWQDENGEPYKRVSEQVQEEITEISGGMSDYSLNEIENQALDNVLSREIERGLANGMLRKKMSEEMGNSWIDKMKGSARDNILSNGGELSGAEMIVFDSGQVVVESSHEIEAISFNGFFSGVSESIFKNSKGPEVEFVQELSGWNENSYSLE